MTAFVKATDALRYNPDVHYALASGVHADRFLSIARLFSDAMNVARIADWLIDSCADAEAILLDQSPMLPLGFALQSLTQKYSGWTPAVEVLEDYPADLKTLNDALVSLSDDPVSARRTLFVLSITCTGRLARMFRGVAPKGSKIRVMLSGSSDDGGTDDIPLYRVPIRRFQVSPDGQCELCDRQVELHRLDARTHETNVMLPGKSLVLTEGSIRPQARFWGIADEMDAVRIHYDDPDTERHHPVYLVISALLGHAEFRCRCIDTLRQLPKPDVVIIPGHGSSSVIADLVLQCFDSAQKIVLPEGRNRIPTEVRPRLAALDQILIADDAVITTKTVVDLKFQIYDICKEFRRSPTLNVFAVVARPVSLRSLKRLRNRLRDRIPGSHLHAAWTVLLPPPGKRSCPFCLERDLLERSLPRLSREAREEAQGRLSALRGTLHDPLRRSSRRIGGSFYVAKTTGEAQDARARTVFGAVQGAAMTLLDEMERRSEEEGRVCRIDDADLLDKCYDPEILGGFLRTFERKFLSWPANMKNMESMLSKITPSPESRDLVAEMAWAAAIGRLPTRAVLGLLAEAEEDRQIGFLKELIRLNNLDELPSGS